VGVGASVGGSCQAYPVIKYYNREENFFVVSTGLRIIQINGQNHLKRRPKFPLVEVAAK
jgi:hypothetical protein